MPASTTYGNSQTIYYTYDGNSQLIGISTAADSINRCKFSYDMAGNLTMICDYVNRQRTNTSTDSEGNVTTTVRDIDSGAVLQEYRTQDNTYTETVGGATYAVTYAYDDDGRMTSASWTTGGTTVTGEIHYDDLDRRTAGVLSAKTGEQTVQILNTSYVYNDAYGFGSSNQVSAVQYRGAGYENLIVYGYDKNGNITKAGDVNVYINMSEPMEITYDGGRRQFYALLRRIFLLRYDHKTGLGCVTCTQPRPVWLRPPQPKNSPALFGENRWMICFEGVGRRFISPRCFRPVPGERRAELPPGKLRPPGALAPRWPVRRRRPPLQTRGCPAPAPPGT